MDVSPFTLQGQHVILQPMTQAHAEGLLAIGQYDPDWLYLPRPCLSDIADTYRWLAEALKARHEGHQLPFVLVQPLTGKVMGTSRYMNIRPRDRALEIGWTWLGRDFQRTPVNTEAKYLLLKHAFETLGALRVELKTDGRNLRSQNAIARIGAVKEGVFRQHMQVRDGYQRDTVWFSIIGDEWPQVKSKLEHLLA